MLENMAGQHGAHFVSQPVIQADRRAVVHHPEPDQRLAFAVLRSVGVTVSLGLQRGVARIKRVDQSLHRQRRRRIGRRVGTSQIKLVQFLADHIAAMLGIAIRELAIQFVNPFQECFFGCRNWLQDSIFVSGHGRLAVVIENG